MAPVTLALAALGARGGVSRVALAAVTAAVYTVGGCEGLRRSVCFNARMTPLVLHYKVVQADLRLRRRSPAARAARYQAMHAHHAAVPLGIALRLGGFYTKIAQVLSSFDEIVPRAYTDALRVLQDAAPARPASYVRHIISQELGVSAEALFESIDEAPLGAASIGQVHRATLRGGQECVVKVQYPNAKRFFATDMRTLTRFCRCFYPEVVPLMREIEKQFLTEFDYALEAALMREAAANLMPAFGRRVAVPLPIDAQHPASPLPGGLCTERVLVMERLHGTSLLRAQKAQLAALARRQGRDARELEDELRGQLMRGELTTSMVPSAAQRAAYHLLLGTSDAAANALSWAHNTAAELGLSPGPRREYVRSPPPLDTARLIRELFEVHGHQLFVDGFFNGDPHPGNIMLLDDGRLGLIDWGQVKRLPLGARLKFAALVVALADRDQQQTAALWRQCGFATQKNHPWALNKWASWRFSRMTPDVVDELGGAIEFEPNLAARDKPVHEPDDFVMVFRLAVLLRGNAMSLGDVQVDSARQWRRAAVTLLKKNGVAVPETVPGRRLAERLDEAGRGVPAEG